MYLTGSARRNTAPGKKSSPATLNAQTTAMELDRDPDVHRNVPTTPLLAPQWKVREKKIGHGEHRAKTKVHMLHIHTRSVGWPLM